MFSQIGPLEIGIVLVIVLLIFGPKRLPDMGKSLGTGMREFKDSITGKDDDRGAAPSDQPTMTAAYSTSQEPIAGPTTTEDGLAATPVEPRT